MLGTAELIVDVSTSYGTQYDIFIDNQQVEKYSFLKVDREYGCKDIRIEVKRGAVKLAHNSSNAHYLCRNGAIKIVNQYEYIDWFYSHTHTTNAWYSTGEVIKFKHLYPQGPTYFVDDKPIFEYNKVMPAMKNKKKLVTDQIIEYISKHESF